MYLSAPVELQCYIFSEKCFIYINRYTRYHKDCDTSLKVQLHDAIYRLRFYSNSLIHNLSLSNSHNNVASIQKNRGDKSHRVTVALLKRLMTGIFNSRPTLLWYNFTWDTSIVLTYLIGLYYDVFSHKLLLRFCLDTELVLCTYSDYHSFILLRT